MCTLLLVGEAIRGSHLANGKKTKTVPSSMPPVSGPCDSPVLQKRYLEFELSTGDANHRSRHCVSESSLQGESSGYLQLSPQKKK